MIGSVVGNYKIIDKIGEGGMGAVFKGVDLMLEREVAIKMLRPELAMQPNVVERFRTEAVTLAKLNHPNVATLHSFFRQGDDFFMVMEFVRGQTLDCLIKTQGALQTGRAIDLFCMALEGIEHAHQMGIVHRDIKPANMMLTETGSIKVMDFGIARVLGTDRLTKAGHLLGTVEYMSPEQIRGEETDARSDIYSLGVLLYEMITGRVPFNSTSEYELMRSQIEDPPTPPRVLAPHIPFAVEQAIMCALAKKPEARYQSANEFRTMLIHKTTGSITKVDASSPASYVTRESKPIATAPSPGAEIKETRLASDPGVPVALGGQFKETRLAPTDDLPIGYQETPSKGFAQPRSRGSVTSRFGNLNWKHYAAAALALVALISFPLGWISGGDKSSTTQPPDAGQPSPTAPAAAPAQGVVPVPNQPIPQPGATSVPAQPGGPADGSGSARSRSTSSKPDQRVTQGGTNKTAQSKSTSAANRAASKTEKVKTAVGGVIKGIGGVLSRKKKPANQQP